MSEPMSPLPEGIGGGATLSLLDQLARSLGSFLATVLVARAMSLEEFGFFSLAVLLLTDTAGLAYSQLTEPIRVLGVRPELWRDRDYLGSQYALNQVAGVALAGLIFIAAWWGWEEGLSLAAAMALALLLGQLHEFGRAFNASRLQWAAVLWGDLACQSTKLAALSVLALDGNLRVDTALGALGLGGAVGFVASVAGAQWGAFPPWSRVVAECRANWRFGKWLSLESVTFVLSSRLQVYAAGALIDVAAIGALNAVQTVVNVVNVLWMGLTTWLLPSARHLLILEGVPSWRRMLMRVGFLLVAGAAAVGVVLSMTGGSLLGRLFAAQYSAYAGLVPIYAAAMVLTVAASVMNVAFRTLDLPRVGFVCKLVSSAIALSSTVPLIQQFGLAGAAVGNLLSPFCWVVVYACFLYLMRNQVERRAGAIR